jgi:hypothetical protein
MKRKPRPRGGKPQNPPRLRGTTLLGPAIVLIAAMAAVWPLLVTGPSCNGDFYFHFVSWADAQRSMTQGILYPHWANSPNFGYGEPRFVFYPPLTWMAGALLGLVLPWKAVSVAFIFLLLAGTGLANRALAREVMKDGPATLAGCAAIFLGHGISDAALRSDYAELTGGFWIPLLLLFLLRRRNASGGLWRRAFDGSAAPLALVVAGIWLSNGPLGIEANYLAIAIALLSAAIEKSWAAVVRATAGVSLGMGLAAVYLLPAVWERRWGNFQEAVTKVNFRVENSWLFGRHADPIWMDHDYTLLRISIVSTAMFAVAVTSILVAWKRGTLPAERRWLIPLMAIPFAVLFLQLPISSFVWNRLPELRFLQFPWRLALLMQPSVAIFFALAIWVAQPRRRIAILAACAVLFLAADAAEWVFFWGGCKHFDSDLMVWEQRGGGYGKPEYAPPGVQYLLVIPDMPANCVVSDLSDLKDISGAPGEQVHHVQGTGAGACKGNFTEVSLPEVKKFTGIADEPGYLILRLRSYPAWSVTVNGQPASATLEPGHGLMAVPVTPGPVAAVVRWTALPDVIAARWISVLSLFLLAVLYFGERRPAGSRAGKTEAPANGKAGIATQDGSTGSEKPGVSKRTTKRRGK